VLLRTPRPLLSAFCRQIQEIFRLANLRIDGRSKITYQQERSGVRRIIVFLA
jgi:hypothetical protein